MGPKLDFLKEELRAIEERIEEQKKRIPPHSATPAVIQELEELEEQRNALADEIARGQGKPA